MSQTSMLSAVAAAKAGQLGDLFPNYVASYINQETSSVNVGLGVVLGSADDHFKVCDADGSDAYKFLGVIVRSNVEMDAAGTNPSIATKTVASILRKGTIWVTVDGAVSAFDKAYVRVDTGTGSVVGAFRADSDSATCMPIPGRFLTSASADGIALLELTGEAPDNQTVTFEYDHAAATADATILLFQNKTERYMVIDYVGYINVTGLAEDASNFFDIQLLNDTDVIANWSTETGEEGTIAAATFVDLTLGVAANRLVAPGSNIALNLDETGTATLPAGRIYFVGHLK